MTWFLLGWFFGGVVFGTVGLVVGRAWAIASAVRRTVDVVGAVADSARVAEIRAEVSDLWSAHRARRAIPDRTPTDW